MNITTDILEKAGFEDITTDFERKYYMEKFNIYYIAYRMWTPDGKLKLNIDNGPTNDYEWNLHIWTLHIYNDACESIGNVSISTVEQFNLMMKVFENKFKICQ